MAKNICLKSQLAIVTGGGRGIGQGTCIVLADLGASVIVVDRDLAPAQDTVKTLNKDDSQKHIALQCDVADSVQVGKLFEEIKSQFHPEVPSILVNNVGATLKHMTGLLTTNEEIWDGTLAINLKSMYLMSRLFVQNRLDFMERNKLKSADAKIVNVSSVRAIGGFNTQPEYNASKGGVLSLTKSVASEFGPKGIRCNAVLPGLVDTPMAREIFTQEDIDQFTTPATNQGFKNVLGRVCMPKEVGRAIAFLASDFSSFVTGTFLQVSGGECM